MRLGVIGHPIAHSLSPVMHTAAIEALGLRDVSYEAIDVAPGELPRFIATAALDGFNVTLPHKEAVMPLLGEVDEVARAIGAVNTVVRDGARWLGTNTDAIGLLRSLEDASVVVRGSRVLVLGAGGAARAAIVGLSDAGAASIALVARRETAAASLALELARPRCTLTAHGERDLAQLAPRIDLVVQATSATLGEGADAFARRIPFDAFRPSTIVMDLVYRPRETTVLRRAAEHGLRTIDGSGMLVHQGAAALSRWLGVAAPVDVMRAALIRALA